MASRTPDVVRCSSMWPRSSDRRPRVGRPSRTSALAARSTSGSAADDHCRHHRRGDGSRLRTGHGAVPPARLRRPPLGGGPFAVEDVAQGAAAARRLRGPSRRGSASSRGPDRSITPSLPDARLGSAGGTRAGLPARHPACHWRRAHRGGDGPAHAISSSTAPTGARCTPLPSRRMLDVGAQAARDGRPLIAGLLHGRRALRLPDASKPDGDRAAVRRGVLRALRTRPLLAAPSRELPVRRGLACPPPQRRLQHPSRRVHRDPPQHIDTTLFPLRPELALTNPNRPFKDPAAEQLFAKQRVATRARIALCV